MEFNLDFFQYFNCLEKKVIERIEHDKDHNI
jgi:hypothetical protein